MILIDVYCSACEEELGIELDSTSIKLQNIVAEHEANCPENDVEDD